MKNSVKNWIDRYLSQWCERDYPLLQSFLAHVFFRSLKYPKKSIKYLIIAGVSLLFLLVGILVQSPLFSLPNRCQSSDKNFKECIQEIIVKIPIAPSGSNVSNWGSGVLIHKKNSGTETIYTVATNDHVLTQIRTYNIETSDGKIHPAKLLAKFGNPDLALLEFKDQKNYQIASLKPAFTLALLHPEDEVFAVGYPIDKSKGFVVAKGKVVALLPRAMTDGYQIGFSADIEQGMSGGALLNRQGELVGIIGKRNYPADGFPESYSFDNKFPVGLFPEQLMIGSSWAIPIEILVAQKPSNELLQSLDWGPFTTVATVPQPSPPPTVVVPSPQPSPSRTQKSPFLRSREPGEIDRDIAISDQTPKITVESSNKEYLLIIQNAEQPSPQKEILNIQSSTVSNYKYQTHDLDKDGQAEVIIDFSLKNSCPGNLASMIYYYEPNAKKYLPIQTQKGKLELRENYTIENLDRDETSEIRTSDALVACYFTSTDTPPISSELLPLRIWKYQNHQLIDVTKADAYQKLHKERAGKIFNYYQRHPKNKKEVQPILAAYLISLSSANQRESGWNDVRTFYKFPDSKEYFQKLEELLSQLSSEN